MKFKTIGVVTFAETPLLFKALDTVSEWVSKHPGIEILVSDTVTYSSDYTRIVNQVDLRSADVIMAIGGDGTFLSAARLVAGLETPIIGINMGTVGFLTDYPVTMIKDALEDVYSDCCTLRERLMLNVSIISNNKILFSDYALNEILVRPLENNLMTDLSVYLNGEFLTDYRSDSLIIASPTGSTAYNLAAGGPIVHPRTDALILNPINPSSLTVRPLVIPADVEIKLHEANCAPVQIVMDGRVTSDIHEGHTIVIKKSKWQTHLVRSAQYGFTNALKDKLGWSGQPHQMEADYVDRTKD